MSLPERLQSMFQESGWQKIELTEQIKESRLVGLYVSGYAAVGVSLSPGVEQLLETWPKAQSVMAELRDDPKVGKRKDMYLLFLISNIDPSRVEALQGVCNDTHVCRKICIEVGSRNIDEVLMETPFFRFQQSDELLPTGSLPIGNISEKILQDLAKSSKERILERLISGEYNQKNQIDETQES